MAYQSAFDYNQTLKEFLAGTIAGWGQVLVGQPFDIVKVRLQTQNSIKPIYNGAVDCVQKIINKEGYSAFYKGTLPPLIGVGACVSIQFACFEGMKRLIKSALLVRDEQMPLKLIMFSGAFAGIVNTAVSSPVEHLRIRMQIQTADKPQYKSSVDAARQIFKKHGMRGIYKGFWATAHREIVAYGTYFFTFELMMRKLNSDQSQKPRISHAFASGALSGLFLWICSFPQDVLKSKIQSDNFSNPKYKSYMACFNDTKQGGLGAFYKGFGPCALRSMPVNAVTFTLFHLSMNSLGRGEQH